MPFGGRYIPFGTHHRSLHESNGSYQIGAFLDHVSWLADVIVMVGLGVGSGKGDHFDCMIEKHPTVWKHPQIQKRPLLLCRDLNLRRDTAHSIDIINTGSKRPMRHLGTYMSMAHSTKWVGGVISVLNWYAVRACQNNSTPVSMVTLSGHFQVLLWNSIDNESVN